MPQDNCEEIGQVLNLVDERPERGRLGLKLPSDFSFIRQLAQLETKLHTPAKQTPPAPASRTPYLYKIQLMQPKLVARQAHIYPSFRSAIIGLFKPNARVR